MYVIIVTLSRKCCMGTLHNHMKRVNAWRSSDGWYRKVLSLRRKVMRYVEACTAKSRPLHTQGVVTENARLPNVECQMHGTVKSQDNANEQIRLWFSVWIWIFPSAKIIWRTWEKLIYFYRVAWLSCLLNICRYAKFACLTGVINFNFLPDPTHGYTRYPWRAEQTPDPWQWQPDPKRRYWVGSRIPVGTGVPASPYHWSIMEIIY